jgi:hypothetical protein
MAAAGLFVGWGAPITGREAKGLEVFNESVQYWGKLQQDGKIESFEVVLLTPHGGDLEGFRAGRCADRRRGIRAHDHSSHAHRPAHRRRPGSPRRRPRAVDQDLPAADRRDDLTQSLGHESVAAPACTRSARQSPPYRSA